MATKYVFVTGGVVSGLGKGITASSFAALMEARELLVIGAEAPQAAMPVRRMHPEAAI